MNAQITVGLQDWEEIRKKTADLEAQLATTRGQLEDARLGNGSDDRQRLADALCRALEIVQFAVANLHPLTVRGWPYQALRELGHLLADDCPGVPQTFRECARGDWGLLTAEMERWEKARAEGREQDMLAEENMARGIPADHPLVAGARE